MATTTINTAKENYVSSSNSGSNSGDTNYNWIGQESADTRRALIEFDLSPIAGSTLNSVHLNIRGLGSPIYVYAQRITDNSWTEYTVTWNNQPVTTTTNQYLFMTTTSFYWIDVTNLARDAIAAGNLFGLLFKKQYEGGSSSDGTGIYRRRVYTSNLTIDYSAGSQGNFFMLF